MDFRRKLKACTKKEVWEEYCGFLDMDIHEYMYVQNRLMQEQLALFSKSGLGQKLMKDRKFDSIDEFRAAFPMTKYEDYADVLLAREED